MVFIVEAFFSGCISKVINDGKDYSWTKIKSVINDKNDRNLSTRIYRVIEKTLIKITDKKFKGTDILYEAIEKIFIEFRDHGSDIESVKCGLGMLNSDVTVERCENFLEKFYEGICQDGDLHKVIGLILQEKGIDINQKEFRQLNKTVEYGFDQLNRKVDKIDEKIIINNNEDILQNKEPVESKTQEYADKWEANMFLNDFDEWDEKAGVNVKLKNVYIDEHLPHFIWGENKKESNNLRDLLSKYISKRDENRMLLILGQPGIGKSTLITWITANFNEHLESILVYKFAEDLKNIDWQKSNISIELLDALKLSYNDLKEKILILDGFDEVGIGYDRREILDNLYKELIYKKDIKNFSLIITCRENYIQEVENILCRYITLQPWNGIQIRSFCYTFQKITRNIVSEQTIEYLVENGEILGIPLILYMVLALNIPVEEKSSIVDVYDKIFDLNGGIYDRKIDNKIFEDSHRIGEIKRQIHQLSRDIAIWMFENEADKAIIKSYEFEKICANFTKNNEDIKNDFLIGTFLKLVKYYEGIESEEVYFVHRSIYEYFVAESIYNSIENAIMKLTDESQEEFASNVVYYLKMGIISPIIGEYLLHKIMHIYNKLDEKKKIVFYDWWEISFYKMIKKGMFFYANQNFCKFGHIIGEEITCFLNIIEILRLLLKVCKRKYLMQERYSEELMMYLRSYNLINNTIIQKRMPNLSNIFLKGKKLEWLNLSKFNFSYAELSSTVFDHTNLEGSIFYESRLINASLYNAKLESANLCKARLDKAYLVESCLDIANLEEAVLIGANLTRSTLIQTNLKEAILKNTNFEGAILLYADLRGANISDINLNNALLEGTIFDEKQVTVLKEKYDLSQTKVFYQKENRILDYNIYELMVMRDNYIL